MFTIDQIKKAHAQVKSGADFPAYVRDLEVLGIASYENYVSDGHTIYYGVGNFKLMGEPKYPLIKVSISGSAAQLREYLRIHQEGQTDYPTFCKQSAAAGVEKWSVDIVGKTCTYYNVDRDVMLVEMIP